MDLVKKIQPSSENSISTLLDTWQHIILTSLKTKTNLGIFAKWLEVDSANAPTIQPIIEQIKKMPSRPAATTPSGNPVPVPGKSKSASVKKLRLIRHQAQKRWLPGNKNSVFFFTKESPLQIGGDFSLVLNPPRYILVKVF